MSRIPTKMVKEVTRVEIFGSFANDAQVEALLAAEGLTPQSGMRYWNTASSIVRENLGGIGNWRDQLSGNSGTSTPPFSFDFSTVSPATIKVFNPGEVLTEVTLKIITAYTPGTNISIGFPADNGEIASTSEIDATIAGSVWEFTPVKLFSVSETLNVYITGSPTVGESILTIE